MHCPNTTTMGLLKWKVKKFTGWNNESFKSQISSNNLDDIREQVEEKLSTIKEEVAAINKALNVDVSGLLPPEPIDVIIGESKCDMSPLLDTDDWVGSTQRMIARKALD